MAICYRPPWGALTWQRNDEALWWLVIIAGLLGVFVSPTSLIYWLCVILA